MNVAKWIIGFIFLSLAGCDLPELSKKQDLGMGDMAGSGHKTGMGDMASSGGGGGGGGGGGSGGGGSDLAGAVAHDMAMSGGDMADDPSIPPGAAIGWCDPGRWVITASISQAVNLPSYAIDGLAPTRFSTGAAQSAGQYLQVDFGGYVTLNQVVMQHLWLNDGKDDYPRGVDVLVSKDGSDWSRKLGSATNTVAPANTTISFPAHAARYLRVQLNQSVAVSWWTVHELTLGCDAPGHPLMTGPPDMGAAMGPMNPNIANWKATASSSTQTDLPPNAFDGNATTRWASGKTPQNGDEWFKLDLGQVLPLSQVWLTVTGGDYPGAWELDLSSDDSTYAPVARGLGTDTTKMPFQTRSARYVMIKQIGSGYDHWWSINELTIY
jgi:hypothetical protein